MKSRRWFIVTRIIVAVITYQFLSCGGRGNIYVSENMLFEDSVATVHIKNLVDTSTVKIYVNGNEAKKISLSNNDFVVKVPGIIDTTAQKELTVSLSVKDNKGANLYALPIPYTKHIIVKEAPAIIYENADMNITGKNLNIAGLNVLLNGKKSKIISQQFGRFTVNLPELSDTTTGQFVNIVVANMATPVFGKKYTIRHSTVHLINDAGKANWTGGFLGADSSVISPVGLIFQDTTRETIGFVTVSQQKMEDGNTYNNVMRTHPHWFTQGIIQGLFPQLIRKNTRIFKAKIGFLNDKGAKANESLDGARFRIRIHYYVYGIENILRLYDLHKTYNKKLIDVAVKIPAQIPEQFSVELAVDAGSNSNSDWAAWVDPRIDTKYFYRAEKIR